jgi:hypothetical protein
MLCGVIGQPALYAQAGCGAAIKKSSHIAERKAAKTEAAKVPRSYVGSVKAAPFDSDQRCAKNQRRLCRVTDKINIRFSRMTRPYFSSTRPLTSAKSRSASLLQKIDFYNRHLVLLHRRIIRCNPSRDGTPLLPVRVQ